MSDVLNPVDIERAIRNCSDRIARGVKVCSDTYSAFLTADHEFDQAFAHAYMGHEGAAHERKYAAELARSPSAVSATRRTWPTGTPTVWPARSRTNSAPGNR